MLAADHTEQATSQNNIDFNILEAHSSILGSGFNPEFVTDPENPENLLCCRIPLNTEANHTITVDEQTVTFMQAHYQIDKHKTDEHTDGSYLVVTYVDSNANQHHEQNPSGSVSSLFAKEIFSIRYRIDNKISEYQLQIEQSITELEPQLSDILASRNANHPLLRNTKQLLDNLKPFLNSDYYDINQQYIEEIQQDIQTQAIEPQEQKRTEQKKSTKKRKNKKKNKHRAKPAAALFPRHELYTAVVNGDMATIQRQRRHLTKKTIAIHAMAIAVANFQQGAFAYCYSIQPQIGFQFMIIGALLDVELLEQFNWSLGPAPHRDLMNIAMHYDNAPAAEFMLYHGYPINLLLNPEGSAGLSNYLDLAMLHNKLDFGRVFLETGISANKDNSFVLSQQGMEVSPGTLNLADRVKLINPYAAALHRKHFNAIALLQEFNVDPWMTFVNANDIPDESSGIPSLLLLLLTQFDDDLVFDSDDDRFPNEIKSIFENMPDDDGSNRHLAVFQNCRNGNFRLAKIFMTDKVIQLAESRSEHMVQLDLPLHHQTICDCIYQNIINDINNELSTESVETAKAIFHQVISNTSTHSAPAEETKGTEDEIETGIDIPVTRPATFLIAYINIKHAMLEKKSQLNNHPHLETLRALEIAMTRHISSLLEKYTCEKFILSTFDTDYPKDNALLGFYYDVVSLYRKGSGNYFTQAENLGETTDFLERIYATCNSNLITENLKRFICTLMLSMLNKLTAKLPEIEGIEDINDKVDEYKNKIRELKNTQSSQSALIDAFSNILSQATNQALTIGDGSLRAYDKKDQVQNLL